jgi:hypothetical protein
MGTSPDKSGRPQPTPEEVEAFGNMSWKERNEKYPIYGFLVRPEQEDTKLMEEIRESNLRSSTK